MCSESQTVVTYQLPRHGNWYGTVTEAPSSGYTLQYTCARPPRAAAASWLGDVRWAGARSSPVQEDWAGRHRLAIIGVTQVSWGNGPNTHRNREARRQGRALLRVWGVMMGLTSVLICERAGDWGGHRYCAHQTGKPQGHRSASPTKGGG